jgi:DNA-binding NtrC family response regulator
MDSHERVLVVDDEKNVRVLFERVLSKEGYQVECAASGAEAIDKLAKHSFDVVVTDLKMDGIDGFDVIKKGKRERRDLPFVLISGYGTSQTASLAAKEGADVFLAKPIDLVDLKTAIKKALQKKRLV